LPTSAKVSKKVLLRRRAQWLHPLISLEPLTVIRWIKNFIMERKIRVIMNGARSNEKKTTAGVAQGTILAPLLFILTTNNVAKLLRKIPSLNFTIYTDDYLLWITGKNPPVMENQLNLALKIAHSWFKKHSFKPNPSKTEYRLLLQNSGKLLL
jgi:hypothetical protein